MMELGGVGVVSVVANIAPNDVVAMITAFNNGNKEEAYKIEKQLKPLVKAMFIDTNPVPVKMAVELLGLASGEVRLPMCEMEQHDIDTVRNAMEAYGLCLGKV